MTVQYSQQYSQNQIVKVGAVKKTNLELEECADRLVVTEGELHVGLVEKGLNTVLGRVFGAP